MNKIDAIYYINLDHRIDRNDSFLKWIFETATTIPVHRISAVYTPNSGHIGCAKSHCIALQQFIDSPHNTCIIFEDDFVPIDTQTFWSNFDKLFNDNDTINFDLVMCSYNFLLFSDAPVKYLKKVDFSYTASGYLLTKTFAKILLECFQEATVLLEEAHKRNEKPKEYLIDVYWAKLMPHYNWYCFDPRIGKQTASYSDIEKHFVDYNV